MTRIVRKTKEGYLYAPIAAYIELAEINKKHGAKDVLPDGALVLVEGPTSPTNRGMINITLMEPAIFYPKTCSCGGSVKHGVCKRCKASCKGYTQTAVPTALLRTAKL